jgi:hypothetical protein
VLANGQAFRNYRCAPAYFDLDRDNVRDLVLGEWYSSIRFYRNSGTNGNPLFTNFVNLVPPDPDSFRNGNPPRIAFADWDGDTDTDLITCDYYGWVTLRENITPSGISGREPQVVERSRPTVLRAGPIRLEQAELVEVYGVSGKRVPNNRNIPTGTYFVRTEHSIVPRKVIITR